MRTQIVTCFFNPAGWHKTRDNMQEMLRVCPRPVDVVELVYDGAMPEIVNYTGGRHYVIQGSSERNVMWQKEALLNIGISKGDTDYVLCLDGDVLFDDGRWLENIEDALSEHYVVQPFDMCKSTHPLRKMILWPSFAATYQIRKNPTWHAKPGYALAFRREVAPLIDIGIAGGGDLLNLCSVTSTWGHEIFKAHNSKMCAKIMEQGMHINLITKGDLGVVNQQLWFMEHGPHEGRRYNDRYSMIRSVVPDETFFRNDDGIWEWNSSLYNHAMLSYFEGRNEDE